MAMRGPPPPPGGPGGPPMDDGYDDEFDDMGPSGPGGGGMPGGVDDYGDMGAMGPPPSSTSMFGMMMFSRKALSVCAILAVLCLEAAVAIQDSQLKTISGILKPKNSFRRRDALPTGVILAAGTSKKSAGPKVICEYYSGFDVPAVKAGKARSVVYHFFNVLALLGMLWLERPGPRDAAAVLGCSSISLPPVGQVGLITFSLLEMWLGSSVLNHYIGTISYIAGYLLVIAGFIGALFGIIFIGKLKSFSGGGGGGPGGPPPPMGDMYDEPY